MKNLMVLWNMGFGLPADASWYKVLTDWGGLIGGVAALVAGLIAYAAGRAQVRATEKAVNIQLDADKERSDLEKEILRSSIAVEIRQMVGYALAAHLQSAVLVLERKGAITFRMLEDSCVPFHPIIYPSVAGRIASLGDEAMDVAIVYSSNAIARDSVARLGRSRNLDDLARVNVAAIAESFLLVCKQGCAIFEKVRTPTVSHIETDAIVIKQVKEAESKWPGLMTLIQRWTNSTS